MHHMPGIQISEGIIKFMDEIQRPITKERAPQLVIDIIEKISSVHPGYSAAVTADVQFWLAREIQRASSDEAENSVLLFISYGIRGNLYVQADLSPISKAPA